MGAGRLLAASGYDDAIVAEPHTTHITTAESNTTHENGWYRFPDPLRNRTSGLVTPPEPSRAQVEEAGPRLAFFRARPVSPAIGRWSCPGAAPRTRAPGGALGPR